MEIGHINEKLLEIAKNCGLLRKKSLVYDKNGKLIEIPSDLSSYGNDKLDFYEVAVWEIKKALEKAYFEGYQDGQTEEA